MKLYETLIAQLKTENDFVSDDGEVKKWVVADKARNYDSKLLALLLGNDDLRKTFFKDVNGTAVFLLEKFLLFIEQKNYLNDSYTAYKNKIGLTIGGKFLNQRNEVELVWPYKDCILEGGQTKEDQKRPEIFFNQTLAQDEITQLLDPKVLTNAKWYRPDGVHPVSTFTRDAELNAKRGLPKDTITDNLIIKGNNLLALHCLKKEFAGKVKLIYIDPPYNTGNDSFCYNDNFNHSSWLTFMKNRLEVARMLLKDDGVIFVQCDDNEQAYLKILMDEVFGKENLVSVIHVQMSTTQGMKVKAAQDGNIVKNAEYLLAYSKDGHKDIAQQPLYDLRPTYDEHYTLYLKEDGNIIQFREIYDYSHPKDLNNKQPLKISEAYRKSDEFAEIVRMHLAEIVCSDKVTGFDVSEGLENGKWKKVERNGKEYILTLDNNGKVRQLLRLKDSWGITDNYRNDEGLRKIRGDWWEGFYLDMGNVAKEGENDFKNGKKPERLISNIIKMVTTEKDIVLDFFGGSGTTAAVAHKMNRQYITCEQIDNQMDLITTRLHNVINGDQSGISKSVGWNPQNPTLEDSANGRYNRNNFIYFELKKYNQAFMELIEKADSTEKLLKIWKKMKEKSFLAYNVDIKKQEATMEEFKQLDLAQQKEVLCALLDKNQLYVNLSDMNDRRFAATAEERKVTEAFYSKK